MKSAPKTLQQAILHFSDYENCREFMIAVRWLDGIVRCPHCESDRVTYLENARVYKCNEKHPKQKFSLKVGTVFEDSPIPLEKWLPAAWLLCNAKNGISSYELHRALEVTQKTAWFMLHRIRLAMQTGSFMKLGGSGAPVEVDETFIGGKAKNMHTAKRKRLITRRGGHDKTIVFGMLERGGRVQATIIPDRQGKTVEPILAKHVESGTAIHTDKMTGYTNLREQYLHEVVDHAIEYVNGQVHTNGLENFWSLLKRGINGTYVAVEPCHLDRYLDEQVFRYNNRATKDNPLNDADRFMLAMSQIAGKRLTYAELTGKVGETAF
jgi:transposase-like protein